MTSVAAVGSFITDNLLDDVEMNPTWEKFRKYIYAVCVVISLYPLYLVLGLTVACQPVGLNDTILETRSRLNYIDLYCRSDYDLVPIRYAGCFLQIANILILVASFWWLHVPKVIDAVRTFAEIRSNILELKMPIDNLKVLICTPKKQSDVDFADRQKLRESCRLLQFVSKSEVCYVYGLRNVLLLRFLLLCSAGFVVLVYHIIADIGRTVTCECRIEDCLGTYRCVVDSLVSTIVFTLVYVTGLLLQAVMVGYGMLQIKSPIQNVNKEYRHIKLMLHLCRNSQPLYSGLLEEFVKYVLSDKFHEDIKRFIPDIIDTKDSELIEIVESFSQNTPSVIFRYLESPHANFKEDVYASVFQGSKYSLEDCIPLAKLFVKHSLWKSLVTLLEYCNSDLDHPRDSVWTQFNQMGINIDRIETPSTSVKQLRDEPDASSPSSSQGKSILYHAMDSTKGAKVTKFLLNCCSPSTIYVHWETGNPDGLHQSMTLTDFIKERSADGVIEPSITEEIERCNSQDAPSNPNVLSRLQSKYEEMVLKRTVHEGNFAGLLKRNKFHNWDRDAKNFLQLISKNQDTQVGVSLLQALFIHNPIKCLDTDPLTLPSKEIFIRAVKIFEYELNDCKNLVKHLSRNRYWELLVYLLSYIKSDLGNCSETDLNFFRSLCVNLDFLEMSLEGENRDSTGDRKANLLKYAFHQNSNSNQFNTQRQPYFSVASFILKISKPQTLYIHLRYESYAALERAEMSDTPHMASRYDDLVVETNRFQENAKENKNIPCQNDLEVLHQEYLKLLGDRKCQTDDESMVNLIDSLAGIKFHFWDENVKAFASKAAENKHWKIVTFLIGGIIADFYADTPTTRDEESIDIEFLDGAETILECIKSAAPANLDDSSSRDEAIARYIISKFSCHFSYIERKLSSMSEKYYTHIHSIMLRLAAYQRGSSP